MNDFGTISTRGNAKLGTGDDDGSNTGRIEELICHMEKVITEVNIATGDLRANCCYNVTTLVDTTINTEKLTKPIKSDEDFTCANYPEFCNGSKSASISFYRWGGPSVHNDPVLFERAFCNAMNPPPDGPCGGFSNPPENDFTIMMTTYTETCYTDEEYQTYLEDGTIGGSSGWEKMEFPCHFGDGSLFGGTNNSLGLKVVGKLGACICDILKDGWTPIAQFRMQSLMASIQECETKNYDFVLGDIPLGVGRASLYDNYQRCLDAIPCPLFA